MRGGVVTFFTMAYIVVLNPIIIGGSADRNYDTTHHFLPPNQVAAVTALAAGIMCIVFGVIAKYPFAFAAGLGINSLLAVTVAQQGITWREAMGLVVIEGVIMVVLAASGLRTAIFNAIPTELKSAIAAGIGCFIAFIGMVDAGLVKRVPDAAKTTVPVGFGVNNSITTWPVLIFAVGVLLMGVLVARQVRGGLLIGIIITTALSMIVQAIGDFGSSAKDARGWSLNVPDMPKSVGGLPNLSLVGDVDIFGAFSRVGVLTATVVVFALLLSNFFDAMGTMTGLGREAGLADKDGNLPGIGKALTVEGTGAVVGGAASASSITVFVESASGIAEGARTGLANIVTGVLFLVAMFFTPLYQVVPSEAAAPALVVVGAMMIGQVRDIDWSKFEIALPAFLTIIAMPFTYSIANGIGIGFITYVVLMVAKGKWRTVSPLLYVVALVFVLYFAKQPIENLFN